MTPDQRLEYELSLSVERDLSAALDTSFEDGMEKGKIEEQRLIAANLRKQGVNIETIALCTGLSVKEVSEL